MKRRSFITLLGGAAAWPIAAHAQRGEKVPRLIVLMAAQLSDDRDAQANVAALLQALGGLGWTNGRNIRIDTFWAGGNAAGCPRARRYPGLWHLGNGAATTGNAYRAHRVR